MGIGNNNPHLFNDDGFYAAWLYRRSLDDFRVVDSFNNVYRTDNHREILLLEWNSGISILDTHDWITLTESWNGNRKKWDRLPGCFMDTIDSIYPCDYPNGNSYSSQYYPKID